MPPKQRRRRSRAAARPEEDFDQAADDAWQSEEKEREERTAAAALGGGGAQGGEFVIEPIDEDGEERPAGAAAPPAQESTCCRCGTLLDDEAGEVVTPSVGCDAGGCTRWACLACAGFRSEAEAGHKTWFCTLHAPTVAVATEAEGLRLHLSSSNSTGYKFVYYYPKERGSKKYKLNVRVGGKMVNLGYFATAEEAALFYARREAGRDTSDLTAPPPPPPPSSTSAELPVYELSILTPEQMAAVPT